LSSTEIDQILKSVEDIKQHIFNYLYNIYHNNNMECDGAIISLNAGSGGVEAEDWTGMILRMYLMWCKKRNISHDIISTMYSADAPNGIKSCELLLNNKMAYELLNKETGVHRLVRMSPFSKSKSRHTSFCAVRVIPNQKDAINIVINEAQDVRIDVMRGHGAGGQHRNKTDSAVRITHLKTGVIAYCQSDRSQHRNKENAFKILRNRLYEIEQNKRNLHKQEVNKNLTDISWGNQIRSYILHPEQRIKDHRTNYTEHDFNYVLDGNLDSFIYSFI
jgi:peptide chain release factor 2